MFALIRMDWTLCRPLLLRWSPVFLLTLLASLSGSPMGLLGILPLAEFAMGYPLFHDLGPRSIEPYVCALPVSRGQIVAARYLSAMGALGGVLVLTLASAWAARGLGFRVLEGLPFRDAVSVLGLMGCLLSALLFLYLPFHFRFGGERGLGLFAATLLGCLLAALARFGWQSVLRLDFHFMERAYFETGAALGWLALGAISLGLSMEAYRRRTSANPLHFALPVLFLLGAMAALAAIAPLA